MGLQENKNKSPLNLIQPSETTQEQVPKPYKNKIKRKNLNPNTKKTK